MFIDRMQVLEYEKKINLYIIYVSVTPTQISDIKSGVACCGQLDT